ncbi:hypothetical protein HS125_02245 [bacterium]|nr:hypothetical protein [bacterium]
MRKEIPILITLFIGVFMVLKFFFEPVDWVRISAEEIAKIAQVVVASSVVLGVANILRINFRAIVQRRRDWGYKLALLVTMFLLMGAGFWAHFYHHRVTSLVVGDLLFQDLYGNLLSPLQSTMFALLAFFIASAAFRAFRVRNLPAALLMFAAILIMLGRVPLGHWLSQALGLGALLPNVADWLMGVPNTAGQRAILIGVALGIIAVGLRVIFGIERPYLKGE